MKNNNSMAFDQDALENEKLERYAKFFQKPLQNYMNINLSTDAIIAQMSDDLQTQNFKANKLVEIAKGFQKLYETSLRNIKRLEVYKETTEYKLESYNTQVEEYQEELYSKQKKIDELINDLEDLEKNYHDTLQEKEAFKKELNLAKKNLKAREAEMEKLAGIERKKNAREKEDTAKKIENFRINLAGKDQIIEDLVANINKLENLLKTEKSLNERLRSSVSQSKSDAFELKNKLIEKKLKKSKYKELAKQLEFDLETYKSSILSLTKEAEKNKLNNSDLETTLKNDKKQENTLLVLEEQQCLESNFTFQVTEKLSNVSTQKENLIYIIPSKRKYIEEKTLKIENIDCINIKPRSKVRNLSISSCEDVIVRKKDKYKKRSLVHPSLSELCINNPEDVDMPMADTQATTPFKKISSSTPFLSEVQEDINVDTDYGIIESLNPPVLGKDPVREYFINVRYKQLCQSVKASCNYTDKMIKIPTNALYSQLIKLKTPLCIWPEAISLYLSKRLKQTQSYFKYNN